MRACLLAAIAALTVLCHSDSFAMPGSSLGSVPLPGTISVMGGPLRATTNFIFDAPDGKTVFWSTCSLGINYFDLCAVRLHADGSRDPQFGSNGFAGLTRSNVNLALDAAATTSTGKFLLAASGCGVSMCIARLHADGALDTTFAAAGWFDFPGTAVARPIRLLIDSGGRTIVVSDCSAGANGPRFCADRLTVSGELDPTYGVNGRAIIASGSDGSVADAALDSNDRMVVAAYCQTLAARACVRRVDGNGAIDQTWSATGYRPAFPAALPGVAYVVRVDQQGRYLVAGLCGDEELGICVSRLSPTSGALDTTFGAQGVTRVEAGNVSLFTLREAFDGTITVAAIAHQFPPSTALLIKLSAAGALLFPGSGYRSLPMPGRIVKVAISSTDHAVFAAIGNSYDGMLAMRVRAADALPDVTFNRGGRGIAVSGDSLVASAMPRKLPTSGWLNVVQCLHAEAFEQPSTRACIGKYRADGSQDRSFGNNSGWAYVPGSQQGSHHVAAAPDAGGRVLVLSSCPVAGAAGSPEPCVSRLTENGVLDVTFGVQGTRTIDGSRVRSARDIGVDASGRALVSGICPVSNSDVPCVMRLTAAGGLDTSFGDNGLAFASGLPAWQESIHLNFFWTGSVTVLGDGRPLIAGTCIGASQSSVCLALFTTAGQPDAGFGTSGVSALGPHPRSERFQAVATTTSGFVVTSACVGSLTCVTRVNSDGSIDSTTFSAAPADAMQDGRLRLGGIANLPESGPLTVQADGRIVLGGPCIGRGTEMCLARIMADGALDPTFGNAGAITVDLGYGTETMSGVLADVAGTLVVAGRCVDRLAAQYPAAVTAELCYSRHIENATGYFDVDDDDRADAGSDAILVLRHLLGFKGAALTGGVIGPRATRSTAEGVATYLTSPAPFYPACSTNITGAPGGPHAMLDGLVLVRVMLGLSGQAVTGGIAFPPTTARATWSDIRAHLNTNCGMNLN